MSDIDNIHEEIETLFYSSVDHIHADIIHRFVDEQENEIQSLQSRLAEAEAKVERMRGVVEAGRKLRMTAPVDDDFPEIMHNFDSELRKASKALEDDNEQ